MAFRGDSYNKNDIRYLFNRCAYTIQVYRHRISHPFTVGVHDEQLPKSRHRRLGRLASTYRTRSFH